MSATSLSIDPALFRGAIRRAFALPALLGVLLAGLTVWQIVALLSAVHWLGHSGQVLSAMEHGEHIFADEALAAQSEILTHDPSFRRSLGQLAADTDQQIHEVQRAVEDNPVQVARFDQMARLHRRWTGQAQRRMMGKTTSSLDQQWMDELTEMRSGWSAGVALEEQLQANRLATVKLQTRMTFFLFSGVCLLLGGLTYSLTRRRIDSFSGAYSNVWKNANRTARKLAENEKQALAARQIIELNHSLEHTNQQLLQRERDLREAQRLAGLGSWELDLKTNGVSWSEELYRVFGLKDGERVPDLADHRRMFTEESWETLNQHIQRAAKYGEPYALELDVIREDGGRRKIWSHGEAERDASDAIVRLRGTAQDITERKDLEEKLSFQAHYDALTGLPNRQLLEQCVEEAIQGASLSGTLTGVLYLDVDNFKFLNDTLGHQTGDLFLKNIAERICSCIRGGDTVARIGGDEFVICCRLSNEAELEAIAERVMTEIRKPLHIEGADAFISLSMGIAIGPRDGSNVRDLLKNADLAMYQAKQFSRDTYMFYAPEMVQRVHNRVETETDLRHAIERNEFLLYYQPRIDLLTGSVTGIESLIRWLHPRKGLVFPGSFIEVAEMSGLIVPIGDWVLDAACRQTQLWRSKGLIDGPVAVNVSIAQLKRKTFVRTMEEVLRRYELPLGSIEVEITESLLLEDADLFSRQINALKELGVHIAIDDFGTRYSNLNYLKKMPIDTLKIDQSFVRDIDKSSSDAAICRSIVALAQNLNLRTVGEGVERFSELAYLRQFGCNDMQGFLLCRPQPPELLEPTLGRKFDLLPPSSLLEQAAV